MKTVAIVGSQARTRDLAPFHDANVDIWVFNEAANQEWCKRADAVFQMHIAPIYQSASNRSDPDHWAWLQQSHAGLIVYMQDVDALVPCSARYPLEEVTGALLPGLRQGIVPQERKYFTSTVSYALALAIYQGYKKILIYGVEMGSNTEYEYQRPCVLFWVGVALGRGITVDFISGDDIFAAPLYGYEGLLNTPPDDFAQRAEELRGILAEIVDRKAALEKQFYTTPNGNLRAMVADIARAYGELGNAEGRLEQNEHYAWVLLEMLAKGEGGYIDRAEFEINIAQQGTLGEQINENRIKLMGVIEYLMHGWDKDHDQRALAQIRAFGDQLCKASYKAGRAAGIMDENGAFIDRWDERIKAAGGARALEAIHGNG